MIKVNTDISVVMTTYNGSSFVREQLESILNQTVPPREIVIVDDLSTDSTFDIIKEYADANPIIRYARNGQRVGAHQNFRKAFALASCPLIAPSDQDDIWVENHLEVMLDFLVNKDVDFVYSQDKILWEDGSTSAFFQYMPEMRDLIWGNNMRGHTFLFRKEMLSVFELVDSLPFDHALALEASMKDKYVCADKELTLWRRHGGVCTTAFSEQSELVIQDVSRRKKICYTFLHLSDEKSCPIELNFEQIATILHENPSFKRYYKVCKGMSKQTRNSLFQASINNALIQEYEGSLRSRIAHFLWAMRFPWVYWFDMHKLHAL